MTIVSVEDQIICETINALIATGFRLSMCDGEETTVVRSVDINEIFAAMKTTEEDYLFVYQRNFGARYGWVRFIYGNDDTEVINDYTVNLEPVMVKITAMINEFEARRG